MTRAHFVKKARRNYKDDGIKKGESYWWWQFAFGAKNRSKIQPKPSQLTQSEFLGTVLGIEESLGALKATDDWEEVKSEVENAAEELRNLAQECEEKKDNMPDSLQDSETGQLLEDRARACEEAADALEGVDLDVAESEREAALEEIQSVSVES